MVYHTPREHITGTFKDMIQEQGLIHFTNKEHIPNILNDGLCCGKKPAMFSKEKHMVWFYIYDRRYLKKLSFIREKGWLSSNDSSIIFKDITDKQLENMRIRTKLYNAVVHIGNFKTDSMTPKYFDKKCILKNKKSPTRIACRDSQRGAGRRTSEQPHAASRNTRAPLGVPQKDKNPAKADTLAGFLAPQVGLEPTTLRLTAACSTN